MQCSMRQDHTQCAIHSQCDIHISLEHDKYDELTRKFNALQQEQGRLNALSEQLQEIEQNHNDVQSRLEESEAEAAERNNSHDQNDTK